MSLSDNFYGPSGLSEEDAGALLLKAHALGVRLFNTSDLYGPYTNETLLVGQAQRCTPHMRSPQSVRGWAC